MNLMNKIKSGAVFNAVIILIVGILFCIRPIGTTGMIANIAGAVLVILGVVDVIIYFVKKNAGFVVNSLFMGILKAVIGVFCLTHTEVVMSVIIYFLSVVVIVDGISNLESALKLRKEAAAGWTAHLVVSLIIIAAGIFMLFNPIKAIATISLMLGILMIFDGLVAIVTILRVKRVVKEVAEEVQLEQGRADGSVIDLDDEDISVK